MDTVSVHQNPECWPEELSLFVTDFTEDKLQPDEELHGKAQHWELIYLRDGVGVCVINDKPHFLKKEYFIFIPKGCYRQICPYRGYSLDLYKIMIEFNFNGGIFKKLLITQVFNAYSEITVNDYFSELYNVWAEKKGAFRLAARAMVMKIIHELIFANSVIYYKNKEDDEESSRIKMIVDYIIRHHQRNIQIEDIACLFNLNPAYLGSYFKKHTGYTIRQYINHIRIRNAKRLLMTGKYTVGQVAEKSGYKNVYYFTKIFKHIEGIPPSQFIS